MAPNQTGMLREAVADRDVALPESLEQSRKVSFWSHPRKTALRRWSFYVHFYAGIVAGLLFSVVGITGSLLVYVPEWRVVEVPGGARVHPTGQRLSLQTLLEKVKATRPLDRVDNFTSASERDPFEFAPDKALNFRTYSPKGERIHTFIDQYSGQILVQYNYNHRFLQKIYELHDNLLGAVADRKAVGRKINAWFAILLMIVSAAGILLWWRGAKYWNKGFEYKVGSSWKRQNWDFHNLFGFFFFLPLLLLAVTGIYYAYDSQYAAIAAFLTHGPATMHVPRASGPGWRSLDEIIASTEAKVPNCPITIVQFAVRTGDSFVVRVHCPGDPHAVGLSYVYVDPATAQVTGVDRFFDAPLGVRIIRLMTPLHYGDVGGLPTRILWIFIGFIPAMMFITGLLMWWNRSLGRRWRSNSAFNVGTLPDT